jgi:AcrR family transcriptional regulator
MSNASPTARRPKDRRNTIETAAADLFAEQGFAGTGVGDIAKRAGITGGAIYRHFSSKDELLETVMRSTLKDFVDATAVADGPAAEQVRQLLSATVDLTLTKSSQTATYLYERPRLSKEMRASLRQDESAVFQRWREILGRAHPEWRGRQVVVRQTAVNGVLAALAERRHTMSRPELDHLVVGALTQMVLAPEASEASETPPTKTWEPRRSRRQALLDAAAELFRQHGYHGVGIDQIGEAAGIAGPTVYGTYASKTEILVDAYDQLMSKVGAATDGALAAAPSAQEGLNRIIRAHLEVAFDATNLFIVEARERQALPASDRERIERRRSVHRHLWADVLREVRPELGEAEARTLVACAFGMAQQLALIRSEGEPSIEVSVALVTSLLLAPKPTPEPTA